MLPRAPRRLCCLLALIGASLAQAACRRQPPPGPPLFFARAANLQVPQVPGWQADTSLPAVDPAHEGGVVLRLVRGSQVPGSPRLDVVLEPPAPRPTVLEEFLAHNLQEMARLERAGQIHIGHVEQRRVQLGRQPAYRVHHEYTVGDSAAQVAVNQVSIFTVREGRGIAITAAGRLELYHPLADQIAAMLEGMSWRGEAAINAGAPAAAPIDLGRVGGAPGSP